MMGMRSPHGDWLFIFSTHRFSKASKNKRFLQEKLNNTL